MMSSFAVKPDFQECCMLVREGKIDKVKPLIESESKTWVQQTDSSGRSLLHWAALSDADDFVRCLVDQQHFEVDCIDDMMWTPLMIACSAGKELIVRLLIAKGADVNHVNSNGTSSLHYAASKNHLMIAEILLENEADCYIADKYGHTALHRSCSLGRTSITKLLLKHKSNINACDKEGNTPLHLACQEGRTEDALLLVKSGAATDRINKEEKTALDYATSELKKALIASQN